MARSTKAPKVVLESRSIDEKLADGHYTTKLDYPRRSDYKIVEVVQTQRLGDQKIEGFDEVGFKSALNAYQTDSARLGTEFQNDAFEEVGITGNLKAQKCWDLAWDHGHSSGYNEVLNYLREFSELIKD